MQERIYLFNTHLIATNGRKVVIVAIGLWKMMYCFWINHVFCHGTNCQQWITPQ